TWPGCMFAAAGCGRGSATVGRSRLCHLKPAGRLVGWSGRLRFNLIRPEFIWLYFFRADFHLSARHVFAAPHTGAFPAALSFLKSVCGSGRPFSRLSRSVTAVLPGESTDSWPVEAHFVIDLCVRSSNDMSVAPCARGI